MKLDQFSKLKMEATNFGKKNTVLCSKVQKQACLAQTIEVSLAVFCSPFSSWKENIAEEENHEALAIARVHKTHLPVF